MARSPRELDEHDPRFWGRVRPARYDEAMNLPGKGGSPRDNEGLASAERRVASGHRRVAFFGGSFDPPHLGHLAVARAARAAFALDAVLFAPVGMQPLKPEGPAASFEDRVAMTRLAIAGEPGFEISLADAPKISDPLNRPTRQAQTGSSRAQLHHRHSGEPARVVLAGVHALLPDGRGLVFRVAELASRRGDSVCGIVDRGFATGAAVAGLDERLAVRAAA